MNIKRFIINGLLSFLVLFTAGGFILADSSHPFVRNLLQQNRPFPVEEEDLIYRMPTPENIRSIYLTANTFASTRGDQLIDLLKEYGGNAIVVDAEFGGGQLTFRPKNSFLKTLNPGSDLLNDFPERIKFLHEQGIYVIARMVVFKDPYMSNRKPEWRIKNKWGGVFDTNWLDPSKAGFQNYNLYVLQELADLGFDEVQLDYIRFPATNHRVLDYAYDEEQFTRVDVINDFLSKARRVADYYELKLSADVFGVIVWGDIDWRGIGQDPKKMPDYLDAIYPMTYPSHYSPGFHGHANPWGAPYGIIYDSIDRFVKDADGRAEIRTWVQGFPLKIPNFGTWFVEEQIKASYEAGATGFAIWSPGNIYGLSWPAVGMKMSDYPRTNLEEEVVVDENVNLVVCEPTDIECLEGQN